MQNKFEEPTPPKRTIKGGWFNVYQDGCGGRPVYDGPWSREQAERQQYACPHPDLPRVACIQIPDCTEGEGL